MSNLRCVPHSVRYDFHFGNNTDDRVNYFTHNEYTNYLVCVCMCVCLQVVAVYITGATGDNHQRVNGYFELVSNKVQNDRPLYHNVNDSDIWLVMMPNGEWWITDTKNKEINDNSGWCHSMDRNVMTPDRVTKWKMWVGGKWIEQSSISVVGLSPDEWEREKVHVCRTCVSCLIPLCQS